MHKCFLHTDKLEILNTNPPEDHLVPGVEPPAPRGPRRHLGQRARDTLPARARGGLSLGALPPPHPGSIRIMATE